MRGRGSHAFLVAAAAVALVACARNAPSPADVRPARVAPTVYADFDCAQLAAEHARLAPREEDLADELQRRADWDDAVDRIGLFARFTGRSLPTGDLKSEDSRDLAANYAQVRGLLDVVEREQIVKRCDLAAASVDERLQP